MKFNIKDKLISIKNFLYKTWCIGIKKSKSLLNKLYPIIKSLICKLKTLNMMNYARIGICIIGVFLCLFMIDKFKIKEADKYVITDNKAEEYFYKCDYKNAINEYKKIMQNDKRKSYWYIKIAEVYSVEGDFTNSAKYINLSKKEVKNDQEVTNYIIFTEFMNKDYAGSLNDGEKALKKYPKNKNIMKTMFIVYMANNKKDKGLELIKGYPLDNKSAYDLCEHARMMMLLGKWDEGLTELKKAWTIDKDEYKIYDTLSQISTYNKDKILISVSDLQNKYPNDIAYKMWMAKILSSDPNSASQADTLLNQLNGKDTGKFQIKLIKASVLENLNKTDEADKLMTSVIKQYPNDYRVLHSAGWYYLNKKDYDKALSYCKQSILKNKNYPDNYGFLMPQILKSIGKVTESEPYFRTAMLKEPYNYNIMLNIANYYWNTTGSTTKALEYFNFAEIVKPDDADIKYHEAQILLTDKKQNEAIAKLLECIKIDDSVCQYHRTLGTIYLLQQNTKDALTQIKLAYHADEQDIMTLNNAGCYYITVDGNIERGLYNLECAYKGITKSTEKYNSDTIKSNYEKAKKLSSDFANGKGNQKITVPDLTFFY